MSLSDLYVSAALRESIQMLGRDSLSRAVLFFGPPAVGKLSWALALAKSLNCETRVGDFCGTCETCRQMDRLMHPDILLVNSDDLSRRLRILLNCYSQTAQVSVLYQIRRSLNLLYSMAEWYVQAGAVDALCARRQALFQENALWKDLAAVENPRAAAVKDLAVLVEESIVAYSPKTRGIPLDFVRRIQHVVFFQQTVRNMRCVVLNGVEFLSAESASALLKVIEEVPKRTLFFLLCEDVAGLLPALRSRCVQFRFGNLPQNLSEKLLWENFAVKCAVVSGFSLWDSLDAFLRKGPSCMDLFAQECRDYPSKTLFDLAQELQKSGVLYAFVQEFFKAAARVSYAGDGKYAALFLALPLSVLSEIFGILDSLLLNRNPQVHMDVLITATLIRLVNLCRPYVR